MIENKFYVTISRKEARRLLDYLLSEGEVASESFTDTLDEAQGTAAEGTDTQFIVMIEKGDV